MMNRSTGHEHSRGRDRRPRTGQTSVGARLSTSYTRPSSAMTHQTIEPKDLRQTFLPPPPNKLKQSALYTSLPEAALHSPENLVELSVAPEYTPGDGRRLPSRMARQRIHVRPHSAASFSSTSNNGGTSRISKNPATFPSTSFALKQQKEIEAFQAERARQDAEISQDREQRWGAMRARIREKEQIRHNESTQRKKMRLARQQAAQQLRDQHTSEREVLSYDERRTRTGVESFERRGRVHTAYGFWKGALDINFESNSTRMQNLEYQQRKNLLEDYVLDTESRGRIHIQRRFIMGKTSILTAEKSERIVLLKHLTAKAQWKAHQDAEVTSFMTQERRARQRQFDEEANTFFLIDQQKKDLLAKRDMEIRKEAERKLAELRAFEAKQLSERRELERIEQEARNNNIKAEEATSFTQIKQLAAQSKVVALERTHKRKVQEDKEWQQECQRQLQPIIDDEETLREEVAQDELAEMREIDALRQQQWEDILVPITFSAHALPPTSSPQQNASLQQSQATTTGESGAPSLQQSQSVAVPPPSLAPPPPAPIPIHRLGGNWTPIFHAATFKGKRHTPYYKEVITHLVIHIKTVEGQSVGDELDINAIEVNSLREKPKAGGGGSSSSGLRILEGTIVDEENHTLCTFEKGVEALGSGGFDDVTSGANFIPIDLAADELSSPSMEGDVLAAMQEKSSPSITLKFHHVESKGEGLAKVVERCLQAVVFRADTLTNTTGQTRAFNVKIDMLYEGSKKLTRTGTLASSKSSATAFASPPTNRSMAGPLSSGDHDGARPPTPRAKPARKEVKRAEFTLTRTCFLRVEPCLFALMVGGNTRLNTHSITYDLSKKGDNAKMYVSLFPIHHGSGSASINTALSQASAVVPSGSTPVQALLSSPAIQTTTGTPPQQGLSSLAFPPQTPETRASAPGAAGPRMSVASHSSSTIVPASATGYRGGGFSAATSSPPDFGGSSLKFRFIEGYQPEEQFHFSNTDTITLRREELKFDGQVIAKVTGRMLPSGNAATREVTFNFVDSPSVSVSHSLIERILSRVNYTCTATSPSIQRRVIEISFTEPKKGALVATSSSIKIEVIVTGTNEQNLTVLCDENTPVILRDAFTTTPEHLRHFLNPSQAWLAHNAVLDSHNNFATRDSIAGGFVRATIISGARRWDKLLLRPPANAPGNVVATADNKVYWSPVGGSSNRRDSAEPTTGTSASSGRRNSPAVDTSNMNCVGKLKRIESIGGGDGRLRPAIQIDFTEGKLATLQLFVRSLVLATEGTAGTLGGLKVVLIEMQVPENQSRKAAANANQNPTRFFVNVKVMPSILSVSSAAAPNSLIKIPRSTNPVAMPEIQIGESALPTYEEMILDGGQVKVSVIEGHSSMEEILLDLPGSGENSNGGNNNAGGDGAEIEFGSQLKSDDGTENTNGEPFSPTSPDGPPNMSAMSGTQILHDTAGAGGGLTPSNSHLTPATTDLRLDPGKEGNWLLMKQQTVAGNVSNMIDNKPFVLAFGGRRRYDNRLDVKFDTKAPVIATGSLLPTVLSRLSYLHHESDPFLVKTLRVTVEDTFGRLSQLIVQLDVVPVHLPSELADPPAAVYFRPQLVNLSSEGLLPLLANTTIVDEDTEKCGEGTMSIEPFIGATKGDLLGLIQPPLESSLRFDSQGGGSSIRPSSASTYRPSENTGGGGGGDDDDDLLGGLPASPDTSTSRTTISWDGDEVGMCLDIYNHKTMTNKLKFSLGNGTPLEACTALMRQLGFIHREKIPQRAHERQYDFRFNAGDEDVPDTKLVLPIHVAAPLLYTLPLFESLTYKEGLEKFSLFPRPILGVSTGTGTNAVKMGGDVIHFHCPNALAEDVFWLEPLEGSSGGSKSTTPTGSSTSGQPPQQQQQWEIFLEKNALCMSVSSARAATGKLAIPSHGFSGVKLATFSWGPPNEDQLPPPTLGGATPAKKAPSVRGGGLKHESSQFTLQFEEGCSVPASILVPAIATKVMYKNTSLGPSAMIRDVRLEWYRRGSTKEHGRMSMQLHIESLDDMTEIKIPKSILSCFEGERCMLCEGVSVTDTDTETFGLGSSLIVEVVGGTATDAIFFNPTHAFVLISGDQVLYQGQLVGNLDDVTTKKRLVVNFTECPIETVQSLIECLIYQTDRLLGDKSKLVTLTLRGSAEVQPTIVNIQVNVHRRLLDCSRVPQSPLYTLGQNVATPLHLFTKEDSVQFLNPDALAGALLSICLVPSTPKKIGRRINLGVDRLTLHKIPEHITVSKGTVSNKFGTSVPCFQEGDHSGISFSFPKVTKHTMVVLVKEVLQCLFFECVEEDSPASGGGKSGGGKLKASTGGGAGARERRASLMPGGDANLHLSRSHDGNASSGGLAERGLVCICVSVSIPQVDGSLMTSNDYVTVVVG